MIFEMKHEIAFRGELELAAAIWNDHPAVKTEEEATQFAEGGIRE